MGCEGCFSSSKGQSRQFEIIKEQATQYAIENDQTVAIYKEGEEYKFLEAGQAIASGIPVIQFISKHH